MSIEEDAPWLKSYGEVKFHIDYPKGSMSDVVLATADRYPNQTALSCMGTKIPYKLMKRKILQTARAFVALGIGDKVTICMLTCRRLFILLYALNYIGAVVSLIHPLFRTGRNRVLLSRSRFAYNTLHSTLFIRKCFPCRSSTRLTKIILTGAAEELGFYEEVGV